MELDSHPDDSVIQMREPRQSWKANVFWGLLFGLLLIGSPLLAGEEASTFEKCAMIAAGVAWMGCMGGMALLHHGRTISCDGRAIEVSHLFGRKRIDLSTVRRIVRNNVGKKLKRLEEIGTSRAQKARRFDTMAPIELYILYDADGKELLRLDRDMEPGDELARFLRRLERRTGRRITDE